MLDLCAKMKLEIVPVDAKIDKFPEKEVPFLFLITPVRNTLIPALAASPVIAYSQKY